MRCGASPLAIRNEAGVHLAGDHLAAPSLDAALRSGRLAAESWMPTMTQELPSTRVGGLVGRWPAGRHDP